MNVLSVGDYSLDYVTRDGSQRVLRDISLSIEVRRSPGAWWDESGSGKTSLAWAIMRHLPGNARETPQGRLRLGDTDLRAASPKALETIRGRRMSMCFRIPRRRSNPTLSIGRQVSEVLVAPSRAFPERGMAHRDLRRSSMSSCATLPG